MSAFDLLKQRAMERGLDPWAVIGPSRFREHVECRRVVAKELRGEPWNMSFPGIARVLRRTHASVMNLIRPKDQKSRVAVLRAERAIKF
jgi:hypothetical protein